MIKSVKVMLKSRVPSRPWAEVVACPLIPSSVTIKGRGHLACAGLPTEESDESLTIPVCYVCTLFNGRRKSLTKHGSLHPNQEDPEYQGGTYTNPRRWEFAFPWQLCFLPPECKCSGYLPSLAPEKGILSVGNSSKPSIIRPLQIRKLVARETAHG